MRYDYHLGREDPATIYSTNYTCFYYDSLLGEDFFLMVMKVISINANKLIITMYYIAIIIF